jgi:hypothetical protein
MVCPRHTLIAFQVYSRRSLEAMGDIGNEQFMRKESQLPTQ